MDNTQMVKIDYAALYPDMFRFWFFNHYVKDNLHRKDFRDCLVRISKNG